MGQVIYRRGWCPHCQRETVNRVRLPEAVGEDGVARELVDCTECNEVIEG